MKKLIPGIAIALMALAPLAAHADVYNGNGATGFGGAVGNGTLNVTSTPDGGITFSLAPALRGTNNTLDGNAVALYLDTKAGGVNNTSTFNDTGDLGRQVISGTNPANTPPSRSVVNFTTGFGADYALSIQQDFIGVFDLSTGATGGPFTFQFGQGQSTPPYTITLTPTQAAQIGINPGGTFSFVGTYLATGVYRSNETIGTSTTVVDPGNPGAAPNAGNNGTVTFTSSNSYTLAPAAAPEPSGLATVLMVAGVLGVCVMARRRHTVQNAA